MTKEQLVEQLCDWDVEMIKANIAEDDIEYLYQLLDIGFKGYSNYTLQELRQEYAQRTYIFSKTN